MDFRIPLGDWIAAIIDWIETTFQGLLDLAAGFSEAVYAGLEWVLITPPFWLILIILVAVGWLVKNWTFALGTALGLLLIYGVDQWDATMETLALVLFASSLAIVISIPLGILAAKSDVASVIFRPILDFLQTMPVFVYLLPAVAFFSVGVVPGIFATIVFSMAPGVRFTELAVRGVDKEVVEAGYAFGSSPWRILRQIQIPLGTPTIMAGINQVIMLSLSMVVIAGLVGAGGLGREVVLALGRVDTALGMESGIAVVILAIYLDRMTATLGKSSTPAATA